MDVLVPVLMITLGVAIAGIWTRDILVGEQIDLGDGLLASRDPDAGTLFFPHWVAEYGTALALIGGAIGLLFDASWSVVVSAVAAGALLYTSVNSLGWALARVERRPYAGPMGVGVVVALLTIAYLLVG